MRGRRCGRDLVVVVPVHTFGHENHRPIADYQHKLDVI